MSFQKSHQQLKELLDKSADELAFLHRLLMERTPLAEPIGTTVRLLQELEETTGHKTELPWPP